MNPSEAERQGVTIYRLWQHTRDGWQVISSDAGQPCDTVREQGQCAAANGFEAFQVFMQRGLIQCTPPTSR